MSVIVENFFITYIPYSDLRGGFIAECNAFKQSANFMHKHFLNFKNMHK